MNKQIHKHEYKQENKHHKYKNEYKQEHKHKKYKDTRTTHLFSFFLVLMSLSVLFWRRVVGFEGGEEGREKRGRRKKGGKEEREKGSDREKGERGEKEMRRKRRKERKGERW
jgi:hypothetical protein